MLGNRVFRKVSSVNGWLQAAARQAALEKAGIPVAVVKSNSGGYLDLVVPEEYAYDAVNLISPECTAVNEAAPWLMPGILEMAR